MLKNKKLLMQIEMFLIKMDYTDFIKSRLKEVLFNYAYCKENKVSHNSYDINKINKEDFIIHLIGFIDGDGCLRSGKRVGHKKGLYRFVPSINIKLSKCDETYLELVLNILGLTNTKIYNYESRGFKKAELCITSKENLLKVINLIDTNGMFLSQKRLRDYKDFKNLLVYLNETKLDVHNLAWVEKGMEIIKDLNTYTNLLSNDTKNLDYIKNNLTWDYALGFIEAEGSLVLHYNTKKNYIFNSFEITQVTVNDNILWGILSFINEYNNPLIIKNNVEINTKGIVLDKSKSRKQPLSRLTLTNNELLYHKIIPLMLSKNLYTKMQINLVYWFFGVIICYKLKDIDECRNLYFKLKDLINSNDSNNLLDLNEILEILNKYL